MSFAAYLTGTDTDAGKTLVAGALLHLARRSGCSTAGVKPVASGCERDATGTLRNRDALCLQQETQPALAYAQINPIALEPAIAPHIAAHECGVDLNVATLARGCNAVLELGRDFTLVEGAGGWRVPLNTHETLADLAKALRLPVILVVGMRLGCINHAVLSAEAIRADGLELVGWVANQAVPEMARFNENLATLTALMPAPLLGSIPHLQRPNSESAAHYLDLGLLPLKTATTS
ncbi:MAG: dethiobiotin synthase [Pseudomonadota bacterium]|nr:dethiobiotin synthase [Pseudomonadota bacterium]